MRAFWWVVAIVVSAGLVHAEDWPHWRGPRYDGIAVVQNLLTDWPKEGPKVEWSCDLTGGYSSVSVVGDRLYTTTKDDKEEVVLCVEAATGKKVWDFRYEVDYKKHKTLDNRFHSGPRSTPTVDGDFVYALGTLGNLHCLEAKTGKKVWGLDLLDMAKVDCPTAGYCNSPLIVGDLLFIQPGGNKGSSLAALKKKDGSVHWKALDDPIGYATPIHFEFEKKPQILFMTGTAAVAVEPDSGKVLWQHKWKTQFGMNIATPIHDKGHVFISSDYGKGCTLLKLQEKGDPEAVWTSKVMRNWFASSVLFEKHVYGFSGEDLTCVRLEDGKSLWEKDGFGLGCVLVAGKHLLILSDKGDLALAEASAEKYEEKARWKALEGTCWSIPVLAEGRLFLRNEKKLMAVRIVKGEK